MTYYESFPQGDMNIVDAVETLTSIADLEVDSPIAVAETHTLELQDLPVIYRTVDWLHKRNAQRVMRVVRDTYKVILRYLQHFYKREHGKLVKHESIEGIKTIMVLVGEAAKKVDKYSRIFMKGTSTSIRQSPEFRDLWTFYQRKIAPIAVSESLAKWMQNLPLKSILEKPEPVEAKEVQPKVTQHVFIDLDSVKKDAEYELFFIRKHDGSRFFNPKLLRNIKLVCNFEQYIGDEGKADPTQELKVWKDHTFQLVARTMLRQNWNIIDQFVKECHKHYNHELAMSLYRAIVALMLSANQAPSLKTISKGASGYFKDFQYFLRATMMHPEYHKLVTYPPKDVESINHQICFLTQEIAKDLFLGFHECFDMHALVNELIIRGGQSKSAQEIEPTRRTLSTKMVIDYDAISAAMEHFGHAPVFYTIDHLQNSDFSGFDNFLMQNVASSLFDLFPKSKRLGILRMPSPTVQNYIHKAQVADEFKLFIRSLAHDPHHKKLLLFNLQDRTGWREFARCHALEELQKKEEFNKALSVVSMTKDSDFYHQSGPYHDQNQADVFIDQLLEHIESENSGYSYPMKVQGVLFTTFIRDLCQTVHELFFAKKNVLSRHSRQDFIELFYLFLQLKIIEIIGPSTVAFCCKDGIDISSLQIVELFILLKLLNIRPLSHEEEEYMKLALYSPGILVRGRVPNLERFTRLNSMNKVIEAAIDERGEKEFHHEVIQKLGPLYDKEILSSVIAVPQPLL